MHYYIDGYNLLFRILRAGDEVRKQREEITFELEKKIALLDLDATLVFDSHYQEGESEKSHYKSLEIIFTAKGETADDFILHELKHSKTPSLHTVVTSDKKLASLCRLRLAETQSVEEFLAWIDKRYKNKLRQKREQSKPSLPIAVPKETKKPEPAPKDFVEGSFDFYLETFNKTYESQEHPPTPKQKSPKPKKVIKKPPMKEKDHLSDYNRWLKAFEERSEQD